MAQQTPKAEWTDRGRAFSGKSRYFSPGWYDVWKTRPRASTSRRRDWRRAHDPPVFQSPALRPLFASEGSLRIDDSVQGDTMDAQQFAELETKFKALERKTPR